MRDNIIHNCNSLLLSSHYWHWVTKSDAEHTAFEDFYNSFAKHLDSLVEIYQAAISERVLLPTSIAVTSYGNKVTAMKDTMLELNDAYNKTENIGLKKKLQSLHGDISKLHYRLTLK